MKRQVVFLIVFFLFLMGIALFLGAMWSETPKGVWITTASGEKFIKPAEKPWKYMECIGFPPPGFVPYLYAEGDTMKLYEYYALGDRTEEAFRWAQDRLRACGYKEVITPKVVETSGSIKAYVVEGRGPIYYVRITVNLVQSRDIGEVTTIMITAHR